MDHFHLAERDPVKAAIEAATGAATLEDLYSAIKEYNGHEIAQASTYCPPARTSAASPIMIVSEKPEPEDAASGKPFSGEYGALMRRALSALGISQENLHVTYAVHWSPGDDRTPNNTQIAASRPFLFREIELVQPRVLLAQGRVVVDALTGYRGNITPILGHTLGYRWKDIELQAFVTWHPAYPLRFPITFGDFVAQLGTFFERYGKTDEETLPSPLWRGLDRAA